MVVFYTTLHPCGAEKNRLFARMNRMRLDFEGQRDAVLAVAGQELDVVVVSYQAPSAELTRVWQSLAVQLGSKK